ncbi:uncharacterized protein LOC127867667 [Dreissena polymorpha]|uniref:BZIP domain-containing protein n=1 Tax=Dreissena polymorpha TaxID=45954 RepID=A0A9D4M170_DREPO|nr:uncharacterized protein LOC127867667 [Dreissena polymorpha]KAH3867940.1 hypothetical protein DPMN_031076 [Dreissena polymorpha]
MNNSVNCVYNSEHNLNKNYPCSSYITKNVITDIRISNQFEYDLTLVNDVITNHLKTIVDDDLVEDIETSLESTGLLDFEDKAEPTNIPRFDLLANAHTNKSKEGDLDLTSACSIPIAYALDSANVASSNTISSGSESLSDTDLGFEELGDLDQSFWEEDISNNNDNVITFVENDSSTFKSSATIVHELYDNSSQENISPVKEVLMYKVLHQRLARGETELPSGCDTTSIYEMTDEEKEKRRRRMKLNRESSKRARLKRKEKETSIKEVLALRTKEYCELMKTHEALKQERNSLQRLLDRHEFCFVTKKPP